MEQYVVLYFEVLVLGELNYASRRAAPITLRLE